MADLGALSPHEVQLLRQMLARGGGGENNNIPAIQTAPTQDSEYSAFVESTHAWAVFADDPNKRATVLDRFVGILIICFQLFTYWLFAAEAVDDYRSGEVPVMTGHANCLASNGAPAEESLTCEAEFTNDFDAAVAFFMLGIFLTGDFLQEHPANGHLNLILKKKSL